MPSEESKHQIRTSILSHHSTLRSAARRRLEREIEHLEHLATRRQYTVLGFGASIAAMVILLLILSLLNIKPYIRQPEHMSVPIHLLHFGSGASSTPSAGNLTVEGAVRSALRNPQPLDDAGKTVYDKLDSRIKAREYQNSIPKPAAELSTPSPSRRHTENYKATSDIGLQTIQPEKSQGLGRFGTGTGSGQGFSVDWGSGGNRIILHKELPKYPEGITTSTQIKMRFTVLPNGSVGLIIPLQKGEPSLERAAIEALRRWQFNPIHDGKEMTGLITFTFKM
ncbi:MAG: TonB family protein, partial [Bacteroidota bacterium]|nr:energy transducer TonB [Candidatus Kapabacteria bacterium]MDW8221035.1 TonB family protein [Bacteroidota bacterium]